MTSSFYSALNGINSHINSINQTAHRVARYAPGGDLAGNMVQMMLDKQGVAANVEVIKATDEMIGSLLDVFA